MYFIHKGSVLILLEDSVHKEDIIGKLIVGHVSGCNRGCFRRTPICISIKQLPSVTY